MLSAAGGDTAWWAHIGGLLAGAALTLVFRRPEVKLFECIRPGDAIAASDRRRRRWDRDERIATALRGIALTGCGGGP